MMLPTRRIEIPKICQIAYSLPSSSEARRAPAVQRMVGHAIALEYDAVVKAANRANIGWHDLICNHLVAGLWEEHYRRPVLACYIPAKPFTVYLCSQSEQATFSRVYARLRKHIGVLEMGSSYVHEQARPVVLWQPPATIVRLWPRADRSLQPDQSYIVDAGNMAGYYSYPYDQEVVEMVLRDPIQQADYSLVPVEEHGVFVEGQREYPCVNRFFNLTWDVNENSDGGDVVDDSWEEDEDIARQIAEACLNQLRPKDGE